MNRKMMGRNLITNRTMRNCLVVKKAICCIAGALLCHSALCQFINVGGIDYKIQEDKVHVRMAGDVDPIIWGTLTSRNEEDLQKLKATFQNTGVVKFDKFEYSGHTFIITTIGSHLFDIDIFDSWKPNFHTLILGDEISKIGESAFTGIKSLKNVQFGKQCKQIETAAFESTGITSISGLPNGVRIKNSAFAFCKDLTSVSLPENTVLGASAFTGCTSLTKIVIPNGTTTLPDYVFDRCTALKEIYLPGSMEEVSRCALNNCSNLRLIECAATIPPKINGNSYAATFLNIDPVKCVLRVHKRSIEAYRQAEVWKNFFDIIPIEADSDELKPVKPAVVTSDNSQVEYIEIHEFDDMVEKELVNDDDYYEEAPFLVLDKMPEFPGGENALKQYLQNNVKYPAACRETNIQGRVLVEFIVDKDGSILEPKVVNRTNPLLDIEALRVISNMPKWKPGEIRAKPVRVRYRVPINFKL